MILALGSHDLGNSDEKARFLQRCITWGYRGAESHAMRIEAAQAACASNYPRGTSRNSLIGSNDFGDSNRLLGGDYGCMNARMFNRRAQGSHDSGRCVVGEDVIANRVEGYVNLHRHVFEYATRDVT